MSNMDSIISEVFGCNCQIVNLFNDRKDVAELRDRLILATGSYFEDFSRKQFYSAVLAGVRFIG